ncbi:MAG: hypothetical protein AAB699_01490 [Patescibacteria group bacterium]
MTFSVPSGTLIGDAVSEAKKKGVIRMITDVKYLKEGESQVQNRETGRMGIVIKTLPAENRFTVRYIVDGKVEAFCAPQDFKLVIPNVKGTVPRGSR